MAKDEARVAVVTGASSGIGKEAAKALAAQGWRVIAHGRDPARLAAAEVEIRAAAPGARVEMVQADLCLLSDTARLADRILALTGRVDALLNNAGGVRDRMIVTEEGNEATFAGNHLGHFLLTRRLTPTLRATAAVAGQGAVRIVNVSSRGHTICPALDWDDLQQTGDWASAKAYGVAKLCNILFTRELARRLGPAGVVAHAMHPGVVASNFASHGAPDMQAYMAKAETIAPAEAADTLIWLATASEPGKTNGLYYQERQPVAPSSAALDAAAAERLWQESETLLAHSGY